MKTSKRLKKELTKMGFLPRYKKINGNLYFTNGEKFNTFSLKLNNGWFVHAEVYSSKGIKYSISDNAYYGGLEYEDEYLDIDKFKNVIYIQSGRKHEFTKNNCILYFLKSSCGKYLKLGISTLFDLRIKSIYHNTPFKYIEVLNLVSMDMKEAKKTESLLLDYFNKYKTRGEWFEIKKDSELDMFTKYLKFGLSDFVLGAIPFQHVINNFKKQNNENKPVTN